MNENVAIFIIISIVAIIICVYLNDSLAHFNAQFKTEIDSNVLRLEKLQKFSYKIYFNPLPNLIDVTNPYQCTPTDLRPCKTNDFTTCNGCKNLIAKCTHFAQNTKYIDANGKTTIIPKNRSKDDGYCLVTQTLSKRCNPHHGNLVLVQLDPKDFESALICECKNPGFIGKTAIDGACENVFVCDGKVKNLNVPFERIECDCPDGFTAKKTKGTPICQMSTVEEFKNYGSLHYPHHTLPSSYFDKNIHSNFPGDKLKDPCRYCLITGQPVNGSVVATDDGGYVCKAEDQFAIPIKSGASGRMLKGATGPDAMVKIRWEWILLYGKMENENFNNMAAVFSKAENMEICQKLGIGRVVAGDWYAIDLFAHEVRFPGNFGNSTYDQVPMGVCTAYGLTYNCEFKTRSDRGEQRSYDVGNYRTYAGEPHPSRFLWKYETWDSVELNVNPVFAEESGQDGLSQFKVNKYLWGSTSVANDIKFLFLAFRPGKRRVDAVVAKSLEDYKKYTGKLISQTT